MKPLLFSNGYGAEWTLDGKSDASEFGLMAEIMPDVLALLAGMYDKILDSKNMAEGRGFEPRRGVNPNTLSRRAP